MALAPVGDVAIKHRIQTVVRACADVDNDVIGRTGTGANTSIGFDSGLLMGKSECVNCGEEIQPKRLDAIPWTPHCIRCQELVEQGLLTEKD